MAIRIVDPVPDKSVVKKVTCPNCGVKLEYTPNDVESGVFRDYGGGSDTYYWIKCPNCKKDITLRSR